MRKGGATRIKEVRGNALFLLRQAGPGEEVEALVADFKDAFHASPDSRGRRVG